MTQLDSRQMWLHAVEDQFGHRFICGRTDMQIVSALKGLVYWYGEGDRKYKSQYNIGVVYDLLTMSDIVPPKQLKELKKMIIG